MKHKLEAYKKTREELIRQIELCQLYKEQIKDTLKELNTSYKSGLIDKNIYTLNVNEFLEGKHPQDWYSLYNNHINKCHNKIKNCEEKINEITENYKEKRQSYSKIFMLIGVISLILSLIFVIQPTITGLIPYPTESKIIFEDGYTKEGSQWMHINGLRSYERCINVNSESDFDSIKIIAKITSATDTKDLRFSLFTHNENADEPGSLIDSCNVDNYNDLWKSCTIDNLENTPGEYWICASNPSGDPEKTYYTISYQIGDSKKTALWTGEYWQRLDRASYTMKAQFLSNDE